MTMAFLDEQEMRGQLEYATADLRRRRSSLSSAPPELDEQSSECLVCLETTGLDARPCCGEPVCLSCLAQHVRSKLDDGVVRIGCPNPECDSFVQVDHELEIVDPELVAVYYRRLVDANSDPSRKTCPNCCLITEFEPSTSSDRKSKSKYGLLVVCNECQFRWCFRCHGPEHPRLKCSKNLAADDQLKKWAKHRSAENDAPAAQRCPSCKIYVERVSGCPHMECRMCKSEFCYFCGERWTEIHPTVCRSRLKKFRLRFRRLGKKLKTTGIVEGRREDVNIAGAGQRHRQERPVPLQPTHQPDAASNRSHPPSVSGDDPMNLFIIFHFMMLPSITGVLFPFVTIIGSAFSGYWTVSSNPFAVLIVSACVGCKIIHGVRNKDMDDAMTFYFFHLMLLPIITGLLFPLVTFIGSVFSVYWTVSSNPLIVLIVSACVGYKIIHEVRNVFHERP